MPHRGTRAAPVVCVILLRGWVRVGLLGLVLATACYSPTLRDCTVACSSPTDCGGSQVCGADGFCSAPEIAGQCGGVLDALLDGNGGSADAPGESTLCAIGCTNGTCVAGVCVINCSAPDSCAGDIVCPANLPCRVECGDRSCDKKIDCHLSTSCDVRCVGTESCSNEVLCGTGTCTVACSGAGTCDKRIKCKEACACDVTCAGVGACGETQECPLGDTCRLGEGCSSELTGCDRCP
ncbi:MAG: hypothetical protein M3680_03660 [Myxococcota bacterium]|nr:hypothetical protein [Myxococcota bacterium]